MQTASHSELQATLQALRKKGESPQRQPSSRDPSEDVEAVPVDDDEERAVTDPYQSKVFSALKDEEGFAASSRGVGRSDSLAITPSLGHEQTAELAALKAKIKLLSDEKDAALSQAAKEKKQKQDLRGWAEGLLNQRDDKIKLLSEEKETALSQAEAEKKRYEGLLKFAEDRLENQRVAFESRIKQLSEEKDRARFQVAKNKQDLEALRAACVREHGGKSSESDGGRRRHSRSRSRGQRRGCASRPTARKTPQASSEAHLSTAEEKLRSTIHESLKDHGGEESLSQLGSRVKRAFLKEESITKDDKAFLEDESISSWVKRRCPEFGTRPDCEEGRNDTIIFIKSSRHGGS